jgi:3-oxoacyl-[acyl-carrier-protein] synthase II
MDDERVVITGMGAITPIGNSAVDSWKNALQGVSGVGPITLFDSTDFLVKIACEVKDFSPEKYVPAKEVRRRDRFEQMATAATIQAIQHSGLEITEANAGRIGVVISSAIGGFRTMVENQQILMSEGARKVNPFTIPMLMPNGAAGLISIDLGIKGPCFSVASACASGADGIGMAWLMIKSGMIDAAVAGASESAITQLSVAAFDRIGAMSRRSVDELQAPQPFDLNRDGLVVGEGAAILILEREDDARKRGANIIAELAGYASTADSYHITAPEETGAGGAQAIRSALNSAKVSVDDVDYINAHGTGTTLNDLSETRAIKAAFGEMAYHIPVSSTKSMTGHMLGSTAALEAVFCAYAVKEDVLPPTINYRTPDPMCDLDYIPNQAREKVTRVAISNAFGFGGHNSVLVLRKYDDPV